MTQTKLELGRNQKLVSSSMVNPSFTAVSYSQALRHHFLGTADLFLGLFVCQRKHACSAWPEMLHNNWPMKIFGCILSSSLLLSSLFN